MPRKTNYYQILGVSQNASAEEIKKAYKKLALDWHPDSFDRGNSPAKNREEAETKFKEIGKAYAILSNREEISEYDEFGESQERKFAAKPKKSGKIDVVIQGKIEQTIFLIEERLHRAGFENTSVTENDLDPNLWRGFRSWQEKVKSYGNYENYSKVFLELDSFRGEMWDAIENQIKKKKNDQWKK